jgi:hypothetical protein
VIDDQDRYPIALDSNQELAAEVGLLLSCYAIIDLYIVHIFATVSGMPKDASYAVLARVKGRGQRIELLQALVAASDRPEKEYELELIRKIEEATRIRNEYAHAIYSGYAGSSTSWRMSMWQSDAGRRRKAFKDVSADIARRDCFFVREVLKSLHHFGSVEIAYE